MAGANVRISADTHVILRKLALDEGLPMQSVLDKAIERYRRERFLRGANADFARLKKDSKAWKEELAERRLWDRTSSDGLDQ